MPNQKIQWVNDHTEICNRLDGRVQLMQDYLSGWGGFYMVLIGSQTYYKDVPEFLHGDMFPGCTMKGLGSESENVWKMCFAPVLMGHSYDASGAITFYPPSDMMDSDRAYLNIFAHEFAHALHSEMERLDPTFNRRLQSAYELAEAESRWPEDVLRGWYREYWAECVKIWFYGIGEGRKFESYEAFAERDPEMYDLLSQWFPAVALPHSW